MTVLGFTAMRALYIHSLQLLQMRTYSSCLLQDGSGGLCSLAKCTGYVCRRARFLGDALSGRHA